MKTADEICRKTFAKYDPDNYTDIGFSIEYLKICIAAMEEYASQFKQPQLPIELESFIKEPLAVISSMINKYLTSEQRDFLKNWLIPEQPQLPIAEEVKEVPADAIGFAVWYSGMTEGKVRAAYKRWQSEQTQPVPSKEVQENQTYGEFMRSNPEISTPSTTDTQDGKLNETFHNYGYPTDGGILGTEVSVKIDNQSNEETTSTTDIEKEAEQLYPYWTNELVEETLYNSHQEVKREAHIKAYQMHRNDGLDQLIEWMEWESHRRWNESHELPDFTEILTKANEIKASLK